MRRTLVDRGNLTFGILVWCECLSIERKAVPLHTSKQKKQQQSKSKKREQDAMQLQATVDSIQDLNFILGN